ncbi:MAG: phosphotransferase [Jatrophihabitantaceae bacterium]
MIGPRVDAPRPAAVLDRMAFGHGERLELEALAGGLTNRNFRVRAASGREYVARFAGAKSALLAIDRDAEAYNSAVAASIGVGPQVVEYAPDEHVLVVEWINGRTFSDGDLDNPTTLDRVAAVCRRLHAGPRFTNDFDMFAVQRQYLRIVQEHGFRLPSGYLDFADHAHDLDKVLHTPGLGTVACHNDLLAANIMDAGSRVWFIDYEYSGNNDPCFELGNIWSEADLPLDRLEHLVTAYFRGPAPVQTARARLFGVMAKYSWTLWAAIQDAVSDVGFDFWTWGMAKYERAVAEFRGSDFTRMINIVGTSPAESPDEGAEQWPTPSS